VVLEISDDISSFDDHLKWSRRCRSVMGFNYEAIRLWCGKFGPEFARKLRLQKRRFGRCWHVDEVFVCILWRAVDQNGEVVDILVQARRSDCRRAVLSPSIEEYADCSAHRDHGSAS
jgi:hypothetical protein